MTACPECGRASFIEVAAGFPAQERLVRHRPGVVGQLPSPQTIPPFCQGGSEPVPRAAS